MREGYKKTEIGVFPVEWGIAKLSDLTDVRDGTHDSPKYVDEGIPFVTSKNLKENGIDFADISYITQEDHEKIQQRSRVDDGDILFAMIGTIGNPVIVMKAFDFSIKNVALIKFNGNQIINRYVLYLLKSSIIQKQFDRKSNGGVQKFVSLGMIRNLLIPLPNIEEQQKIADILYTVDKQIEQTEGLIEKTKELKKGLMQWLLTKGIGHTQFKKTEVGKIPIEWKVMSLLEISQSKGEYGIGEAAIEYVPGKPRYLRITDIGDENRLLYHDIKGLDHKEYQRYLLKENDIVFARTGNTTGKSYVYSNEDGELVYAGFLIKFCIEPTIANVNFIKYVVQSKRYWDWVSVMSTRSGQPGINSGEYSKLLIQIPETEEQTRIASILLSVDKKIKNYESKKEKLQTLKKALMQQLLTGRIRVKVS